jgi:hypothetical protein
MLTARPFQISGVLSGPPATASYVGIHLISAEAAERDSDRDAVQALTVSNADGRFRFLNVPPGRYVAKVAILPAPPGAPDPPSPPADRLKAWASETVQVVDRHVEMSALALHPPVTISGRIEFEDGSAMPSVVPSNAIAYMAVVDGGLYSPPAAVRLDAEGRFQLKGAMRGRYHLFGGFPGWGLKQVIAAGADITMKALEVGDRDISDVRIVLTRRVPVISGTVVSPDGSATADAEVVLFPADYRTWIANGLSLRGMVRARVSSTGQFGPVGVLAGSYLAAAVRSGELNDWPDRRIFEALASVASPVVLLDGRPAELRLTVVSRR